MNEHIINITAGTSKRLYTAGMQCESDIIVNAVYDKTKPIPYEDTISGKILYSAKFNSDYFVDIDDSERYFYTGGQLYNANGVPENPYLNIFRKSLVKYADVGDGDDLIIDANDTIGQDHRFAGYFPYYTLEDKVYTCKFTYARNFDKRHKVYFAMGTFYDVENDRLMTGCGCDANMPLLGIQLYETKDLNGNDVISYAFVRQSVIIYPTPTGESSNINFEENIFNSGTIPFNKTGSEFIVTLKIVYDGGFVTKNPITLYAGYGKEKAHVRHWTGHVIPVIFKVYLSIGTGSDSIETKIMHGGFYQPASVPLIAGIGNYDVMTEGQYYGIRNFEIYKGDISIDRVALEDLTEYSGSYQITPKFDAEQILNTDDKYLVNDLVIKEIPKSEWDNVVNLDSENPGIAIKIG